MAEDLAYAAGIIDGEGYIAITKFRDKTCRAGYHYALKVQVGMSNPTIPMWLHLNFGGSLNTFKPYKQGWKPRHIWQTTTAQAGRFLELILPYLKEKIGQAQIAVEFQKAKSEQLNKYNQYTHKPVAVIEAEAILAKKVSELNRMQFKAD